MTGDAKLSSYRTGPDLGHLFNYDGANDEYGQGFPSRWQYAQNKLRGLNGTPELSALLCKVLDPRKFMDSEHQPGPAIEYLNQWLKYDHYEIALEGGLAKVRNLQGDHVEARHPFQDSKEHAHLFINEQIEKSERKIQGEDYDGAITNARSLVEAVLTLIESSLDSDPPQYDGDLPRLYKRV